MRYSVIMACSALCLGGFLGVPAAAGAAAATADVHMVDANGIGKRVGTVTFEDNAGGLTIMADLYGLKPGTHGFHIHAKGSCEPSLKDGVMVPANAAGGHYDPYNTGRHLGPDGGGHKGDLPALKVASDGTAKETMTVKALSADEVKGKALMIHEGGDNYSDLPKELGGGGGRLACGVIR